MKRVGSCQSCTRQLCNGLRGKVATVSEGSRGGQPTRRCFSLIGTSVKAGGTDDC